MVDKKQLEIVLQQMKEPVAAKPDLEQYTIPADLAASMVHFAYMRGDIKGKTVFDFGCGTGRLAIGAAVMGAKKVVGVDIDEKVIEVAKENLKLVSSLDDIRMSGEVGFIHKDIQKFRGKGDTVLQNPPFGIQAEHLDRLFLEKALQSVKVIYSLHKNGYFKTRRFLRKFIESKGGEVEEILKFVFTIPHMFKFHTKEKYSYNVDLYVIKVG